ncbi:metalloregulator ArsR/SmtB family transcription factor [Reichenbachiella sp. MALMAid0571]|uniref:ArsR/SmtB family transcription factor n=1 Tax=Reichenbachiella sp. MALMAid0571 TaxID=3143939 RepID=UPI0032DE982D
MKLKNFNLQFGTQIFKSFSDESRVRIMYLLYRNEELCISDLELILDFTQTKTSRHITYLKHAGLLSFRKQDQWVFYHVKEEVLDIVDRIFKFLNKDTVLLKDYETFEILNSNRELSINKIKLPY